MGVRYACISPGARNSPLTYTFAEKSEITCYSHIDERSSAFFGLGIAKSTKRPVVLISTSGTAPANFYPAVIEASLSRVPLIILSADRPDFLVGTGSNQTINQQLLYGNHVRYFTDMGLPINKFDLLQNKLDKAVINAIGSKFAVPPGPVHLNFPFNEPLMPDNVEGLNSPLLTVHDHSIPKFNSHIPKLTESKCPLIIVGPMEGNTHQEEIIEFAEKINAPILTDPLSQLRYGFNCELILAHYDLFLRYVNIQPDKVIRFGRKPTSKVLCQLLKNWRENTILIDAWQQFNDDCPNFIQSSIDYYCREQVQNIDWKGSPDWLQQLLVHEKKVKNEIQNEKNFHEGIIAKICFESIKDGGQFFIGNSMPIRDVDMFTTTSSIKVTIFSNRGASGIDGVVSTALGTCVERKNAHSLLLIGDLSFCHDMNGLLATQYGINLTIVVINNSGGGIFSFLPIADLGVGKYEEFWTTDTGLNLEKVAELYNCKYYLAENIQELESNIQESYDIPSMKIIEVKMVIKENIKEHRNFLKIVKTLFSNN